MLYKWSISGLCGLVIWIELYVYIYIYCINIYLHLYIYLYLNPIYRPVEACSYMLSAYMNHPTPIRLRYLGLILQQVSRAMARVVV